MKALRRRPEPKRPLLLRQSPIWTIQMMFRFNRAA
jgi:hypothetical protein